MTDGAAKPGDSESGADGAIRLSGIKLQKERFSMGPLDCVIPRGMVTAIVGPNGSGKSTLFRLLLGMEPIPVGTAEVLGVPLHAGMDDRFKVRIGFLSENSHAYENSINADEKAAFAAHWYDSWDWERYRRLLRHFDADGRTKLSKLSKGMRRKAEFCVVLGHNPELLLLDEPSSGLDPFAWKVMIEELQRYMEQGDRTLVLASHVTDEIRRLADYILFLYRGRILGLYEKDRLFDEWRTLLIQLPPSHAVDRTELNRVPGVQGITAVGPGLYRLEVDEPDQGEAHCRKCGYEVLAVQRMELEEILSCLIRKEETKR